MNTTPTAQSAVDGACQWPVRVIAITSGKGGVGKSSIAVNLAAAFVQRNRKVMIMDADLGLANVDVMVGLRPSANLSHVVSGERTLEEVMVETAGGIKVVPASSGLEQMATLTPAEHAGIVRAFSSLRTEIDLLIVDTAAGIGDNVVTFAKAAQEVVIVVCDEPASLTDSYALIKLLNRTHGIRRFHLVANMVRSSREGNRVFQKLLQVTDRFLDEVVLDHLGSVPYDDHLRKAVKKQHAVVDAFPRSPAALAFRDTAEKIDGWPLPKMGQGQLEFFVERLLLASGDALRMTV